MDFRIYENDFKATHRFAKNFELEYDENLDVLRCEDRYEPVENIKYVYFKDGCIRVGYKDDTYRKGRIEYFSFARTNAICEFLISKGVNAMGYSEYLQWHRKEVAMKARAEAEAKRAEKEAKKAARVKQSKSVREELKYSAYSENNDVKKREVTFGGVCKACLAVLAGGSVLFVGSAFVAAFCEVVLGM